MPPEWILIRKDKDNILHIQNEEIYTIKKKVTAGFHEVAVIYKLMLKF